LVKTIFNTSLPLSFGEGLGGEVNNKKPSLLCGLCVKNLRTLRLKSFSMNKKYLLLAAILWIAASCTTQKNEQPLLLAKIVNTSNLNEGALFTYDAQNRLVSVTTFDKIHGYQTTIKDTITYNEKGAPATLTRYEKHIANDTTNKFSDTTVHKFVYDKTAILCDDSIHIDLDEHGNLKQMTTLNDTVTCSYDSSGNLQKLAGKKSFILGGKENNEPVSFNNQYSYDERNGAFKNCATPRWLFTWMAIYNKDRGVELDFESVNNNRVSATNIYNGRELQMYFCERRYNRNNYPLESIWLKEKDGIRQPHVINKYEYISTGK
jgi:hypothetical protein